MALSLKTDCGRRYEKKHDCGLGGSFGHGPDHGQKAGEGDLSKQLETLRAQIRSEFGAELPPLPVPESNPQPPDKSKLGEALFFDPNSSSCGTIACVSCHVPEMGFSDEQQISGGCGGATGRSEIQRFPLKKEVE